MALRQLSGIPTPDAIDAATREQRWLAERGGAVGWKPAPGPGPDPPPPPPPPPPPARPYKPIAIRAQILRWWLTASIGVYVVVTVLNGIHLSILDADDFAGGGAVTASDERLLLGTVAQGATFVVSAVLWLVWFHRAYANLPSLGAIGLRFGTGWSVGAWFIPVLNLFRPKQIANDIWRGTDAAAPRRGQSWTERPVAPLVHWWWAAWLAANLTGAFRDRLLTDAQTLAEERAAVAVDMAAGIIYVVSALLALLFVRRVTAREAVRAAATVGAEADAERVRAARERLPRERPVRAALVLAGAAALVLSVTLAAGSFSGEERNTTGEVSDSGPVSVFELRAGDCVNGLAAVSSVRAVEATPCEQPHQAEVLSTLYMSQEGWPGQEAVLVEADERCAAELAVATAGTAGAAAGPSVFYLHPTEESWSLGDREITCIAMHEVPQRGAVRLP